LKVEKRININNKNVFYFIPHFFEKYSKFKIKVDPRNSKNTIANKKNPLAVAIKTLYLENSANMDKKA
jgi:hypothetical protein